MAQVLLVPAIDHARAPEGEATYEERRQGEERGRNDKWSDKISEDVRIDLFNAQRPPAEKQSKRP
jgi:hypothetical protein